jgi:branched-chain amino acid transport system permease protein
MDFVLQQILNALAFGSEYALLALGLAIVFSIMGLVNFAHGEIITIGAYTMYIMVIMGLGNPVLVIPFAILAAVLGALVFERVAFRPVRNAPTATGMLAAFGVSILVQNAFLLFISARPRAVSVLGGLNRTVEVGPLRLQLLQILELGVALAVALGLVLFLTRSVLGLAMRAAARDFAVVRRWEFVPIASSRQPSASPACSPASPRSSSSRGAARSNPTWASCRCSRRSLPA